MGYFPKTALLGVLLLSAMGGVGAAHAAGRLTKDGEVVVTAGPPPTVAGSYPADGASVPGGLLVLKITFNQSMTADQWGYSAVAGVDFPRCLSRPRLLNDQRTFVLLCSVAPDNRYAVQINAPSGFSDESGRPATPVVLRFSTGDFGPHDLHEALTQAGLTDVDDPIMTERNGGAHVSDAPAPTPPKP